MLPTCLLSLMQSWIGSGARGDIEISDMMPTIKNALGLPVE
jgi:hypothetical protein